MAERGQAVFFVIEIIARIIAHSQKVGILRAGTVRNKDRERRSRFHIPDVFADFGGLDFLVQTAVGEEQRRAQVVKCKAAARALSFVFAFALAVDDALHALGGNAFGIIHHFNENEFAAAAVFLIHIEDGVGRGAAPGKGIEDDGIRVC